MEMSQEGFSAILTEVIHIYYKKNLYNHQRYYYYYYRWFLSIIVTTAIYCYWSRYYNNLKPNATSNISKPTKYCNADTNFSNNTVFLIN